MGIFDKTISLKTTSKSCCGGNKCSESDSTKEDAIREIAYFAWLSETGGAPVSDEESKLFWLKAEQEFNNKL